MKTYPKTECNNARISYTQNGAVYTPRRRVSAKWGIWAVIVAALIVLALVLSCFPSLFDEQLETHDINSCVIPFTSPTTGKEALQVVDCEEYQRWLWRHSPNYRWYRPENREIRKI